MNQTDTTIQILKDEYQITCVIEGSQSSATIAAKELKKLIQQQENRRKNTIININNDKGTKPNKNSNNASIVTHSPKVGKEKPPVFESNIQQKKTTKDKIHVFVDYSNIFIPIQPLKLNVPKLVEIVEQNRTTLSRNVVGSKPPDNGALWSLWKSLKYNVVLGQRLERKEIFVDEALHSMMIRCIYDHRDSRNNVLVLLSGDGNDHVKSTATFPVMCEFALKSDWKVEVWSWKKSLNSQFFNLRSDYPNKFSIRYLDDHKEVLTKDFKTQNQTQLPFQSKNQIQLPFQNKNQFQHIVTNQLPFQNQIQFQTQNQTQGQTQNQKPKQSPKNKSPKKPNSDAFPIPKFTNPNNQTVPVQPSFIKFKPYTLVLHPCFHNCTITDPKKSTVTICPYCDKPVTETTIQQE